MAIWQTLHDAQYFERHPLYDGGRLDTGQLDLDRIERFVTLSSDQSVVVIGCGYGRETAHLCKRVALVYGIDVNEMILAKAVAHLGATNFRPVLSERYAEDIPDGIDFVYSTAVMQHLTRDLAADYMATLGRKLSSNGRMLIQFLESDCSEEDASVNEVYEPSVSWTKDQIALAGEAAGLATLDIRTDFVRPGCFWHWALLART